MNAVCSECHKQADCRIRTENGAYGPVDTQTCEACHAAFVARCKAEDKRLGFRTPVKGWARLSDSGAYSKVV